MDTEQTFLRVHARLSGMLSQLLTPRIRMALEYVYLTVALALFCLLVVMHTNFVHQPGCSNELSGTEFTEAQLIHITITSAGLWAQNIDGQNMVDIQEGGLIESSNAPDLNGVDLTILTAKFWSKWIGSGAKRDIKAGTEELHTHLPIYSKDPLKVTIIPFANWWQFLNTAGWNTFLDISRSLKMLRAERLNSLIVQWLDKRNKAFEPTYLYTVEKGFFLLPEGAKSRHNVRSINITISAKHSCFGNRWQQLLINRFVGYDTILMNSLLSSPGQGYLYNFQTKEFYDLSYGQEPSEGPARFGDYLVAKCGVLIMSLFVFLTTTMSVSFTLRETQSRMLNFTVQLQHHARHQLPTFQLIFVHIIESLVFVPIMIGILFFLFEFYDDQLLAFLVLTLVWLCEVFTMISVRTAISMQFFPRFFLLYFLVFHIYFFSYSSGFSYLAFAATAAFMQHLILYFWNRFEVPALQRYMRGEGQMQQRAGVQITSSTIYTSTLHIARLNVRNTSLVNNELGSGPELLPVPDPSRPNPIGPSVSTGSREQSAWDSTDSANTLLQFPDLSPQQEGAPPGLSLLNPFGSLLLWILGGASSDGIISFFSMFRDMRDQGQPSPESSGHENEQQQ